VCNDMIRTCCYVAKQAVVSRVKGLYITYQERGSCNLASLNNKHTAFESLLVSLVLIKPCVIKLVKRRMHHCYLKKLSFL